MNYADRSRNLCYRHCTKEAGHILELDDTLLYCSYECKTKGDKYRNKELQNDTTERNNNNNSKKLHSSNKDKETICRCENSKYNNDPDFTTSSYSSSSSSSEDEEEEEEKGNKKKIVKKKTKKSNSDTSPIAVTNQQRTQFRQLNHPISLLVAWDKPKRSDSPT